ncbi:hypothetical protein DH2020_025497 [Rehmannia glutinosa]|uniref:R2R3-MYB protein n=1 Tax=Rehmannia glutinosa TaxID=99300 RepID=A0ABR0VZK2_REHGL
MGRSPCCDKSKVKRGTWSPEEDATLINYLNKHGTGGNWIALPQKAGLRRCGKSCRLRWLNYLRPDIKHASQLPGRTDNDVKNYWNTKLKKKLMATHSVSIPPTCKSSIETATAASRTTTISDKATIFRASTNSLTTSPEPFLTDNTTGLVNANAISTVSYEPVNFTFPRFILEGSSNFSSVNNNCPYSLSHQNSSPFRPFALGIDENYGVNGITMDEYSCEVVSGIWSQDEDFGADSNDADLFSILQGVSQSH